MLSISNIPSLSQWFNKTWTAALSSKEIWNHYFMLGNFQSNMLNPVIWSVDHEMRISIIFPLIMLLVMKINWKKSIGISITVSLLCLLIWYISINFFNYNITEYDTSFLLTLHYISFFILGALLAKYQNIFQVFYAKMSKGLKLLLLVISALAYTYSWWFLPNLFFLHITFISDWIIAIGSLIIIILCLNSKKSHLLLHNIFFVL
ncbi:hypothetical protein ASG89_29910 [Paenibacillus sp. Soil766]|nr:hypothetical protein ASG89_29910 [Paenibacillus sp. Soil766]